MAVGLLAVALTAAGFGCGTAGDQPPLAPSASRQDGNEFASPIRVTARVAAPPAVGERAVLAVEIVSVDAHERARVFVELPANLEFATVPRGLIRTAGSAPNPIRNGPRASGAIALAAGRPVRLRVELAAKAAGPAEIAVRVTAPVAYGVVGGVDYVFLSIGDDGSVPGVGVPQTGSVTTVSPG
jgi:hypothetical protein